MSPDRPETARGFVNAHTHVYSGLAPLGMPAPGSPPENFVQILARVWWRLDRALDEGSLRAAARLYVAEALLHGTTTVIDHHESPNCIDGSLEVIADACDELGVRAVLCFGATERNGGREEARQGLAECRRFIRANRRPLVKGLVGLHAAFTVSDATIRDAGELCAELGAALHVHVAEDRVDIDDAWARHYAGPIDRLRALGALPRGSILAHGVHLGVDEVRQAEAAGCWIVQNPRSNRHNGVGYPGALGCGRSVALGTDGFVSDMRAEMAALLEESGRQGEDRPAVLRRLDAGHALVAELFGAAANDACVLADDGSVARLSIGGRVVVRNGTLETGDLEEIRRRAAEAAPRLWQRMAEIP
ncbi:MAG TPA: amidohydrolase family protein [Vicinamibacterales bacterium]|nr:amidohydrolase family protein [Vicinamibacterales bacterium]